MPTAVGKRVSNERARRALPCEEFNESELVLIRQCKERESNNSNFKTYFSRNCSSWYSRIENENFGYFLALKKIQICTKMKEDVCWDATGGTRSR